MGIKQIKIFLLIFSSAIIIFASFSELPACNLKTAKQAIAPRIFFEQTIDGPGQNVYLTRLIHNKATLYLSEFSFCYFFALSPLAIFKTSTILGLIFWLYFSYKVIINRNLILIMIVLLSPLLYFFGFGYLFQIIQKLASLLGIWYFSKESI